MHKTRNDSSKILPITRKGTKYVIVPSHSHKNGIPLLIAARDILGVVKTKKEMKKVLLGNEVCVNGKLVREENTALVLFDTIGFKSAGKYYRIDYTKNKKITLEEINEKESELKISKIINKKVLSGGKVQINFNDGRNIISKENAVTGDSALINMKNNKIEKILPIKEKAEVLMIKGKHLGSRGQIEKIEDNIIIVSSDGIKFETNKNEVIVTK